MIKQERDAKRKPRRAVPSNTDYLAANLGKYKCNETRCTAPTQAACTRCHGDCRLQKANAKTSNFCSAAPAVIQSYILNSIAAIKPHRASPTVGMLAALLPFPAVLRACGAHALRPLVSLRDFNPRNGFSTGPLWRCSRSIGDTAVPAQAGDGGPAVDAPAPASAPAPALPGGLYLVATPIGCLEDISMRAVRVLRDADKVLCEDTRRTVQLLNHLGIKNTCESFHAHNEHGKSAKVASSCPPVATCGTGSRSTLSHVNCHLADDTAHITSALTPAHSCDADHPAAGAGRSHCRGVRRRYPSN